MDNIGTKYRTLCFYSCMDSPLANWVVNGQATTTLALEPESAINRLGKSYMHSRI